jgi:hypothetical protein
MEPTPLGKGQSPVPITGLWLRTIGGRIEVLLEIDGFWRLINDEPIADTTSHITETLGIRKAPLDRLYSDAG